ncbi:unnamed protein product [Orchesella dallaii]|uniref:Uncharacterized protein n=1 Tax=Orchesella dallaii TaxID=48710 RepID=A0ABP1Q199_9HEXA
MKKAAGFVSVLGLINFGNGVYICVVKSIETAFRSLGILANEKKRKLSWIIKNYKGIERLFKQFHKLFGMQLVSICITFLLPILLSGYELMKVVQAASFGFWEKSYLIGGLAHLVGLSTTFFLLCDASTEVNQQATNCVASFQYILSSCEESDGELEQVKD